MEFYHFSCVVVAVMMIIAHIFLHAENRAGKVKQFLGSFFEILLLGRCLYDGQSSIHLPQQEDIGLAYQAIYLPPSFALQPTSKRSFELNKCQTIARLVSLALKCRNFTNSIFFVYCFEMYLYNARILYRQTIPLIGNRFSIYTILVFVLSSPSCRFIFLIYIRKRIVISPSSLSHAPKTHSIVA